MIEATVTPSDMQAFAHRPALARSKCGFENRIKNTFFIRSVSAYRELIIAAVFVITIVQHRTSVLDKTASMCSKTSRVDNGSHVDRKSRGPEVTWTGSHVDRKSRGPEVTWIGSHVDRKSRGPEVTWTGSHVDRKSRGPEVTWTGSHVDRKSRGQEVTWTGSHVDRR